MTYIDMVHAAREGRVDVEAIRDSFTVRVLQSLRPVAVDSYARVDERLGIANGRGSKTTGKMHR